MSSLIDASETLGQETLDGETDSGIIHFDATQRRKNKMREKSHQETPPAAKPKPQTQHQPSTPPTVTAPTPKAAASLDAYNIPPAVPTSVAEPTPALDKLSGAELEQFLIDFVVEQTGYPPEMVEMDADLEADLGIDSIKKAQLFGELAEQFSISVDVADESLSLDDFPTLQHVMGFLENQSGSKTASAPDAPVVSAPKVETVEVPTTQGNPQNNGNGTTHQLEAEPAANPLAGVDLESFLVEFVVEQTGYPPEMVELDADLEADLGIDSIKKAQLFGELAEQFEISVDVADENLSLDDFPTLRHVMEFLQSAGSQTPAAQLVVETAPVAVPSPSPNGSHLPTSVELPPEPEPVQELVESSPLSSEELETFLVNFVVEQTGYPPEMVELDADLEADLGIDSIKKAQMMGELAEQFEITVDVTDENLSLDDFPTLRHVCEFLAAPRKAAV